MIPGFIKTYFAASILLITSCQLNKDSNNVGQLEVKSATSLAEKDTEPETSSKEEKKESAPIADAATILARPQVPILCYHQIRGWKPTDSKVAKDYIVPDT